MALLGMIVMDAAGDAALQAQEVYKAQQMMRLELVCGYAVCAFLGLLSFLLLWMVWKEKINLDGLLAEYGGQASVSRFQLVIFTMVIALSLFVLTIQDGRFPVISPEILILLGISASTYAVGKGIAYSQPQVLTAQGEQQTAKDISATGANVISTSDGVIADGAVNPVDPAPLKPVDPVAPQQGS